MLCGPAGDPPRVVTVPLNTLTALADRTVVLSNTDHTFVNRPTYVNYHRMREMPVQEILALEALGNYFYFERHDPVDAALLTRIIEGAFASPLTPARMAATLRARLDAL